VTDRISSNLLAALNRARPPMQLPPLRHARRQVAYLWGKASGIDAPAVIISDVAEGAPARAATSASSSPFVMRTSPQTIASASGRLAAAEAKIV